MKRERRKRKQEGRRKKKEGKGRRKEERRKKNGERKRWLFLGVGAVAAVARPRGAVSSIRPNSIFPFCSKRFSKYPKRMAGEIEAALDALEREAVAIAPFSELNSRNGAMKRIRLAERALRIIAGEDPRALFLEVCGFDNKTTEEIAKQFANVRKRPEAGREAESWNASDQAMTRREREWAINSLSFLARKNSRGQLRKLGVVAGEDLYASIKAFCRSGSPIYETPERNYPGRKRHQRAEEIEDQWVKRSQVVSRTNRQGGNLRIVLGGKAEVARSIVSTFKCSTATAYHYCPSVVVAGRKHSDLCLFCEALRRLRLECIRRANKLGANISELGEFSGQGEVRSPGTQASIYLRSLAIEDGEVAEILRQVDTLTWRETLGQTIAGSMQNIYGKRVVVCFDYSSGVKRTGYRGDAGEFFRPKILSLFGIMFVAPKTDGEFERSYIDIFSFDASHTSNEAAMSLKCGLSYARSKNVIPDNLSEVAFFSDKAKHFCSGEMAYGVLFGITANAQDVSYTYHACYHGKTPLGAHFARIKEAVNHTPVGQWPSSKREVKNLALQSVGVVPKTEAVFLDNCDSEAYCRKKLVIPDISCAQRMRRRNLGPVQGDVLTVEDKAIPIRPEGVVDDEPDLNAGGPDDDIMGGRVVTSKELCGKIKKQMDKLSRYQNK